MAAAEKVSSGDFTSVPAVPMKIRRKVAIVTGGTSGIGLGSAEELANQGYHLILGFLRDQDTAEENKKRLEDTYKIQVEIIKGDVSDESTIPTYFRVLEEKFDSQLTALVHVAGLYLPGMVSADPSTYFTTFETYDYFQSIYPKSFIRLVEAGTQYMENGRGYIVAVSSPGCNQNSRLTLSYMLPGQAKASLEYLARHYAKQLAPRQITCNIIVPGFILTKPWKEIMERKGSDFGREKTLMGRWGEPKDVGGVIGFLCSEAAAFVTGAIIPVDGGYSLGPVK